MAENEAAKIIKDACDEVVADKNLKAECDKDGKVVKTFCNFAVRRVAEAAGYKGFDGLLANDICDHCAKSPEWGAVDASRAAAAAKEGMLVVAAIKGKPHGHVATVYPSGGLVYSGKWKCDAPIVANVGKTNGLMGANYAFGDPPLYYVWTRKV